MKQRLLLSVVLFLALVAFATSGEEVTPTDPSVDRGPNPPPVPQMLLNNPRCRINYDIRNVGPSGVRQVELYLTRDEGRSWTFYGTHEVRETTVETSDGPRPAGHSVSVDLLREGVYGLYLLPKSGVGLGKQPPQAGTRPQLMIEVDVTPPTAELYALKPHPELRDSVVLTWKSSDRNLSDRPVSLEWSAAKLGRWQKIACEVENTGSYVWKLSPNLPARVFLRVTAKDRAGNVTVVDTPEAVCLDAAEPEAVITGVEPLPPRDDSCMSIGRGKPPVSAASPTPVRDATISAEVQTMRIELTEQQARILAENPGATIEVVNPRTSDIFILVPQDTHNKTQRIVDGFTRSTGWDDPELNVYEEYRKP